MGDRLFGLGSARSSRATNPLALGPDAGLPVSRPPKTVVAIAGGYALLEDATVWRWSAGGSKAAAVDGLTGVSALSSGGEHTCALIADGAVKCWGKNGRGQLGDGTMNDSDTPVTAVGADARPLTGAIAVAAGLHHTCVLMRNRAVECWGNNYEGEVGRRHASTAVDDEPRAPFTVAGVTASAIAAGYLHTCALATDGTVSCWGFNSDGELGGQAECTVVRDPGARPRTPGSRGHRRGERGFLRPTG